MPDYAQKRPPLKEPVTDGEYKMMGLSAYGEPRFAEQVRRVVRTERDQCRLDLD
jgi:predicted NodU family carbamoyl transferase